METYLRPALSVVDSGGLTGVQDFGRYGWKRYGVTPSGAADRESLAIANRLLGNAADSAGLELIGGGQLFNVLDKVKATVVGGLTAYLNDHEVPPLTVIEIATGDTLRFEGGEGWVSYLCLEGGIVAPETLNSKSATLTTGLGGGALAASQIVRVANTSSKARFGATAPAELAHKIPSLATVRAVPGPHYEFFSEKQKEDFWNADYTVAHTANRQAIPLQGAALQANKKFADLTSEAATCGTVQIMPDGMPTVLFVEHQTIGGYPQITVVVGADIALLAQLQPGRQVRFVATEFEEARRLATQRWEQINSFEPVQPRVGKHTVHVDRQRYDIELVTVASNDSSISEARVNGADHIVQSRGTD